MASIQQQEGSLGLASGGLAPNVRGDRSGATVVADGHGRYLESVRQGNVYVASNQAAQALSIALSTTQTGFTLTNPSGSGVNLVILDAVIAIATAPAGISTLVWAANVNTVAAAVTQTTALIVRNCLLGSSKTGSGLAASAVTLPAAPVVVRAVGGGPAATGSVNTAFIRDEVAGALVLVPGTAISLSALTTAISVIASVIWEEVPA